MTLPLMAITPALPTGSSLSYLTACAMLSPGRTR
jgi:hypothetical protein